MKLNVCKINFPNEKPMFCLHVDHFDANENPFGEFMETVCTVDINDRGIHTVVVYSYIQKGSVTYGVKIDGKPCGDNAWIFEYDKLRQVQSMEVDF